MELFNENEFRKYIEDNYELFIESDDSQISSEIPSTCDMCQRDAFLKVYSRTYDSPYYDNKLPRFINIYLECPNCRRKSFIQIVQFIDVKKHKIEGGGSTYSQKYKFYKLYRIPVSEDNYINEDIPSEYSSLRKTVSEANFCLSNSKFIASAILYRRAIQILTKDILGGQGKTLFKQLEWLKTNTNKLNIDLTEVFHDNSKIIKDLGNQGAHPDDDITLHEFSKDDANGLHDLFLSIVHDVYIIPAKLKALQDELKKSRKLK
jgi:hypothetical protein